MLDLIVSGAQIYSEQGILKNAALGIKNNKIKLITAKDNFPHTPRAQILNFPEGYSLVPGFIDLHTHGANGRDVMDGDFAALKTMCQALAEEGTTSFLATTMTASLEEIEKVLVNVSRFVQTKNQNLGAEILGVHLEGPFLSPHKVGAQRADKILFPDIEYIKNWQKKSDNIIKLVTLAPELPNSLPFIRFLKQQKIVAAIGHSDATYQETLAAIDAGCSHVTHLFNAMRGIHQREPGIVTAALLSDDVSAELIVDGVHLHPAIVCLALKAKEKIVLVTDAMRAKCLGDGHYDLGDQSVEVKNNIARLPDGTLAGSTLKMSSALQNILNFTHCSLEQALKFVTENPAKTLNLFHQKGSLAREKDADMVVLDEKLNVVLTICAGKIVFDRVCALS